MAGVENRAILLKPDFQFKGRLTENYVFQQFKGRFKAEPRYFADKTGEIDLVLQHGTDIIPVEIKGGTAKSAPSFKRYISERSPACAVRLFEQNYSNDGAITNLPLYLAPRINDFL